jgi:hypothetical protein
MTAPLLDGETLQYACVVEGDSSDDGHGRALRGNTVSTKLVRISTAELTEVRRVTYKELETGDGDAITQCPPRTRDSFQDVAI